MDKHANHTKAAEHECVCGCCDADSCIALCDFKGNDEYELNTQTMMEAIAAAGATRSGCSGRAQPEAQNISLILVPMTTH